MPQGTIQMKKITAPQISKFLTSYVEETREGLKRFYRNPAEELSKDSDRIKRAVEMANILRRTTGREIALLLTMLVLYDLVMLIDNSLSMSVEQDGERIETLIKITRAVAQIYTLSTPGKKGITAIKSLNSSYDHDGVTTKRVNSYFRRLKFEDTTPIGTALNEKVLKKYVHDNMPNPLLVIIITDGEIEGEPKDYLKTVIMRTAGILLENSPPHGPQAVSYQFAKIGDDLRAKKLVQDLDDDPKLCDYIDCLLQSRLEDIADEEKRWEVLPKLLLGAIYPPFDKKSSAARTPAELVLSQPLPDLQQDLQDDLSDDDDDGLIDFGARD